MFVYIIPCLIDLTCSSSVRVAVSCFYSLNDTQMIAFTSQPLVKAPMVETGYGELHVVMRLALGMLEFKLVAPK